MRRPAFVWAVGILAVTSVLVWGFQRKRIPSASVAAIRPSSALAPGASLVGSLSGDAISLDEKIKFEASRVGQIDEDSDGTDARLDAYAESATPQDREKLAAIALEVGRNEDERFLAADLLARSTSVAALPIMEKVVLAPFEFRDEAESTRGSIEWALRGRLIEGFEKIAMESSETNARSAVNQSLKKVIGAVNHKFLAERANEVAAQINNDGHVQARRIEDQDKERLKAALEKSAR